MEKKEAELTAQIELEKRKAHDLEQKRLALQKGHGGLRRVHPPHRAANDEDVELVEYVEVIPDYHHDHHHEDHHYSDDDHYEGHHGKHHDKHHDKHHSHYYESHEPLYL